MYREDHHSSPASPTMAGYLIPRGGAPPRAPACLPNDELTNHTPLLCGHTGPRRATQATQGHTGPPHRATTQGPPGPHRATRGHTGPQGHAGHTGHWPSMHGPPYLPLTSSRSLLSGLGQLSLPVPRLGIIHLGLYIWDYPIIGDYTSGIIHLGLSHVGGLSHLGSYRA